MVTLCGILVAGLWPFHSPKNQVHWLENENGLRFGHYGTILSSGMFEGASSDWLSCSLEIWLEPAFAWNSGTLIAFYSPWPTREFSLQQRYTDLALQRDIGDQYRQADLVEMHVQDVFRKKQAFITVTSDGQETAVYIDGQLAARSPEFGLSTQDLTGTLIVATSPLQSDSWSGKLRGLALYRSELSAAQIAQHYEDWTQKGKPTLTGNESALALYLFDEHTRKVIRNEVRSGIDLYIPELYLVIHQTLMESPWKEVHRQKNYLENGLINVGGFVPLGLSVYAYFSWGRCLRRPAVATVVVGAMVSLAIEVLQSYLPTRYSGMTDVVANTLGTCIGVVIYNAAAVLLARVLTARHWTGCSGISLSGGDQ